MRNKLLAQMQTNTNVPLSRSLWQRKKNCFVSPSEDRGEALPPIRAAPRAARVAIRAAAARAVARALRAAARAATATPKKCHD